MKLRRKFLGALIAAALTPILPKVSAASPLAAVPDTGLGVDDFTIESWSRPSGERGKWKNIAVVRSARPHGFVTSTYVDGILVSIE